MRVLGSLTVGACLATLLGCGARASLDGDETEPKASVSISLGSGDLCRSKEGIVVRLTNEASGDPSAMLTWSASVSGNIVLDISASKPLAPGASTDIRLKLPLLEQAHVSDVSKGVLHLATNDPRHPSLDVPIDVRARGAELNVPNFVDFGETDQAPPNAVAIQNFGDEPVDVSVALPKDPSFYAQGVTSSTIPAGATRTFHYGFQPNRPGLISEKLAVTIKGPICGTPPQTIELRGRGFVGDARLSTTALDYGLVDCGTQGTAQTVELSNAGLAPFSFATSFGAKGGGFTVTPSAGTVASGAKVTLTVTPNPLTIPIDVTSVVSNALTVTTSIANGPPHVVDLYQTARGASLQFNKSPVILPKYRVGIANAADSVSVYNSGNVPISFDNRPTTDELHVWGSLPAFGGGSVEITTHSIDRPEWVGNTQSYPLHFVVTGGGPLCSVSDATASFVGTAHVLQVAASNDLVCINTGDGYVFCNGTNHFTFPGPAPTLPLGSFAMAYMRAPYNIGSLAVFDHGICIGTQCSLRDGSTSFPVANPFEIAQWGGEGAAPVVCGTMGSSNLGCIGKNPFGAFGTGSTHSTLSLVPEMVMLPGAEHIQLTEHAGYAWTPLGAIRAAGLKQGGNLGTSSVPDGLVTTPVVVDTVNDARGVTAFTNGACAVRADATVWCWDTNHVPTPRGGITGAWSGVAPVDYDHIYAISFPQVLYFDGTTTSSINGLNGNPSSVVGSGGTIVVSTSTGGVARLVNGVPAYLPGFDGL